MKDLSSLAEGSVIMNSSMQAGGTVSVRPPFAPEGSESEASAGIPTHSQPNIDLGPNNDGQLTKNRHVSAGSVPHSAPTWKKV